MTRVLPATLERRKKRPGRAPGEPALRVTGWWKSRRALIAALAILLPLAAFVPLAVEAWNRDVASWDESVSEKIHSYENRETILNSHVDFLGAALRRGLQVLGLLGVLCAAAVLLARGQGRRATFLLVAVLGAAVMGIILKAVFAQPPIEPGDVRPSGFEFPSGHALRSMAAAAAFVLVCWPTKWRWPVVVAGTAIVLTVGVAVVYHEWHLVSEVLGGWCVALAWVAFVWFSLGPRVRTNVAG